MGLDAVVYRNAKMVSELYGEEAFETDATTGEAVPVKGVQHEIRPEALVASEQRLGNVDQVGFLRQEVQQLLGDSVLTRKVLHSGSHSGDVVAATEFPKLRRELDVLKERKDVRLNSFLEAMESLLAAGEAEQNPIVFV
jgi:hypothetical protein